jgi:hypothetical protein
MWAFRTSFTTLLLIVSGTTTDKSHGKKKYKNIATHVVRIEFASDVLTAMWHNNCILHRLQGARLVGTLPSQLAFLTNLKNL